MISKNKLWDLQYKQEYPVYADFSNKFQKVYDAYKSDKDINTWFEEKWTEYINNPVSKEKKFFDVVEIKETPIIEIPTTPVFSFNKKVVVAVAVAVVIYIGYRVLTNKKTKE